MNHDGHVTPNDSQSEWVAPGDSAIRADTVLKIEEIFQVISINVLKVRT